MTASHMIAGSRSISSTMLAGVKLHDDRAWNRLYAVWQPVVYDWCRERGLSAVDADDVVQNVFLQVNRKIGKFQRKSFRGWMWRITSNERAQHFRDTKHVPSAFGGSGSWVDKIPDPDAQEPLEPDGDRLPDCEEPAPKQTDQLIVRGVLAVIRNDFEKHVFQAFWRTAMDGHPPVDVAKELKMRPDAVRAASYRVRNRLREELDGMLSFSTCPQPEVKEEGSQMADATRNK